MTAPKAPKGVGAAGRRLWRAVLDEYELEEHEMVLLRQAVRIVDLTELLQEILEAEGPLVTSPKGELRAHPAAVELRQQRVVLARLIVALRVPIGDLDDVPSARPQRRGTRGVYGIRGAVA